MTTMMLYMWQRLPGLTSRYHSSGGLVVVAPSLDAAQAFMKDKRDEMYAARLAALEEEKREIQAEIATGEPLPLGTLDALAELQTINASNIREHYEVALGPAVETLPTPVAAYPVQATEPHYHLFPNAGCC